jgi:hypothetical protein
MIFRPGQFNERFSRLAELSGAPVTPHLFVARSILNPGEILANLDAIVAALERRRLGDCMCPCHDEPYRCHDCCEGTLKGSA